MNLHDGYDAEGWIGSFAFGDFRREREEARSIDEKLILRCPPSSLPLTRLPS